MNESIELELIVTTLVNARLERGDEVYVFAGGSLKGKLNTLYQSQSQPAFTYTNNIDAPGEECLNLIYTPSPRQPSRIQDLSTFKWTRKAISFSIPIDIAEKAVFLQKLDDGIWFLNINTAVKA